MIPPPFAAVGTVAAFGSYLRANGYMLGIAEQQAMVAAVVRATPEHYRQLEALWRSIVCTNRTEWHRYPQLFRAYWRGDAARGATSVSTVRRSPRDLRSAVTALHAETGERRAASAEAETTFSGITSEDAQAAEQGYVLGGASAADPLARRRVLDWQGEDRAKLRLLAEAVAKRIRRRLTRRVQLAQRGRSLDLRRTLRHSLKYGGLPLAPAWQRRRRELPRIFFLVDVSRSMELYAQLFLRVARPFSELLGARVFVFNTRLTEVTPLLRRTSEGAQERMNAATCGFGGGTRIATSLQDFGSHARARLSRRSVIIVCSDGYDTDPPAALCDSLRAVTQRGARVYWLHPTRAAALSAALEQAQALVAAFVPAHDFASLERITTMID